MVAEAAGEGRVDRVPLAGRAGGKGRADALVGAQDRRGLLLGDPAVERVGVRERHLLLLVHPHVANHRLVLGHPVAEVRALPGHLVEPPAHVLLPLAEARGLRAAPRALQHLGQVGAGGRVARVVAEHHAELRAVGIHEERPPSREDARRRVVDLEVPGVDRVAALHEAVLRGEAGAAREGVVERADGGVELAAHPGVVGVGLPGEVDALDEEVLDVRLRGHAHHLDAVVAARVAERAVGRLVEARLLAAAEEVPDHPVLPLRLPEEVQEAGAAALEVLHALERVDVVADPGHVVVVRASPPLEGGDPVRSAAVVRPLERLAAEPQELLHAAALVVDGRERLEPEVGRGDDLPGRVDEANRLPSRGSARREGDPPRRGHANVLAATPVEDGHGARPGRQRPSRPAAGGRRREAARARAERTERRTPRSGG